MIDLSKISLSSSIFWDLARSKIYQKLQKIVFWALFPHFFRTFNLFITSITLFRKFYTVLFLIKYFWILSTL